MSNTGKEQTTTSFAASEDAVESNRPPATSASSKKAWRTPTLERLQLSATASRSGSRRTDNWNNNMS